jgi:hypothetical protein
MRPAIGQRQEHNGDGSDSLRREAIGNIPIWFMNGSQVASTGTVACVPLIWSVQSANSE